MGEKQRDSQRRQAEASREQVLRMKAERNCLRNMSSSSEDDPVVQGPRGNGREDGYAQG